MAMADAEIKRLAHADYWDARYSETGEGQQCHEWFRSFNDLEAFFEQNLPQRPPSDVRVLHLGSGDSVSWRTPPRFCSRHLQPRGVVGYFPPMTRP